MVTDAGLGAVTLRGPPRRLTAVVRLEVSGPEVLPVAVELPGGSVVLRGRMMPLGQDASEFRLELLQETPPGTYHGVAPIGGKNREIVVVVEPVARLRFYPKTTTLTAGPGSREEFAVTVVNAGNVPLLIPRIADFDLEDDSGPDRALGRALRAELGEKETRMDRLFEELREVHGGEARVTVVKGAGVVEPGQSRELFNYLDVPVTLKPGRTYAGGWDVGEAAHLIVIEAVKGDARPARRGRRKT
ncbi:MAG: hypothetical protein Q8N53_08725 [Longimicrobiales bacterium]|nr:hypothetical protein [Longimicrobiales bacterium]